VLSLVAKAAALTSETTTMQQIVAAADRCRAARMGPVLVALDGRSATGKSTMAAALAHLLDATVVEGDDFYAGGSDAEWRARTPARRVALCIDWQRMRAQALEPLLAGRPASWHPFDWESGAGLAQHTISCEPAPVLVLDGVYSGRPELADLVDVAVLLRLPEAQRLRRLATREGDAFMADWHRLWESAEEYYFAHVRPPHSFDVVIGP